jgi:hypothetical protein
MFIPFAPAATALTLLVSSQLPLQTLSRAWLGTQSTHRCTSSSHQGWSHRPAQKKEKGTSGRDASRSIQIVSFGP